MHVLCVNWNGLEAFECIAAPEDGLEIRRPTSADVVKTVMVELGHTIDRIVARKDGPVDSRKIRTPAGFIQSRVGYVPSCAQSGGSRRRGAGKGYN